MTTTGRQVLSREVIAETALRLTDDVGLAGLSMRKLGAELGVEAMSLYHYVDNKDDLLDAILEQLYEEIELPVHLPDDRWEDAIRLGLRGLLDVLLRHPAALELFSSRPATAQHEIEVLYWSYRRFEVMGLSPEQSLVAFNFAVSFAMGHAAQQLGSLSQAGEELDLSAITNPAHQAFVIKNHEKDSDALFEAGVDLVVAGLRAMFDLP